MWTVLGLTGLYGIGLIGGAIWGGFKGFLAGWLAAGAIKSVVAAAVYAKQSDPQYGQHAMVVGAFSVVEAGIAAWLGSKVLRERKSAGKAAWSVS
jgi:hypothetical protein